MQTESKSHMISTLHSLSLPRSAESQLRFQLQLRRGVGFRDRNHVSAPIALAEEDDLDGEVVSAQTSASRV